MPTWVKDLDHRIIIDERAAIMGKTHNLWNQGLGLEPLNVHIIGCDPFTAEQKFLSTYHYLASLDRAGVAQWQN